MKKHSFRVLAVLMAVLMVLGGFSAVNVFADIPENNFGPNNPIMPDDTDVLFLSIETEAIFENGNYQYHKVSAIASGGVAPYTYSYALDGVMSDYSTAAFKYMFLGENKTYEIAVNVKDNMGTICSSMIKCEVDFHATADEASPDENISGYTVYMDPGNNKWNHVCLYGWNQETGEEPLGLWPGKTCKQLDNGIWEAFVPDNCTNVMFYIDGGQSVVLEAPKDANVAVYKGMDEHDDYIFEWNLPVPTDPTTEATEPTETTEPSSVAPLWHTQVYFDNSVANFSTVYVYTWTYDGDTEMGPFPGTPCVYEGSDIWSAYIPSNGYVIFSDATNQKTTNDLINPGATMIAKLVDKDAMLFDWFEYAPETSVVTEPLESSTAVVTAPVTEATDPTEAPSSAVTEPKEPEVTTAPASESTTAPETSEATIATEPSETPTEPSETPTEPTEIPTEPTEIPTTPANDDQAGTNRYYFYRPAFWLDNEYSDTVGIYWWEGTDACAQWPGYEAKKADAEGVYYYDVPKEVQVIIWNNHVNGGMDSEAEIYSCAYQTDNITSSFYESGESVLYPDGVDSFDGMIYVCTPYAPVSGHFWEGPVAGEWYYYYGNGEYGITPEKGDKFYTCSFQTGETTSASFDEGLIPYIGDVNCDGKLNIRDVTLIQKYLAKIETFYNYEIGLADYNKDYKVNIKDATTIQKKLANII